MGFNSLYFIDQIENAGGVVDRPVVAASQAVETVRAAEEVQKPRDGQEALRLGDHQLHQEAEDGYRQIEEIKRGSQGTHRKNALT